MDVRRAGFDGEVNNLACQAHGDSVIALVFSIADFLQFGNGCELFTDQLNAIAFQREHAGLDGLLLDFMGCFVLLDRFTNAAVNHHQLVGADPSLVATALALGTETSFFFALLFVFSAEGCGEANWSTGLKTGEIAFRIVNGSFNAAFWTNTS